MHLVHLPINTVAFERLCIPARGVRGSAEVGIGIQSVAHVPSGYAALLAPGEPGRSDALGAHRISGAEHLEHRIPGHEESGDQSLTRTEPEGQGSVQRGPIGEPGQSPEQGKQHEKKARG